MANMGYCRFQNTLRDLEDCNDYLHRDLESAEERIARRELIDLCREIASEGAYLVEGT